MQQWQWATESTVLDKVALGIFLAAMIALVVCGCILTRKPRKGRETKEPTPPSAA
jgi:hypothetical protein